jgi:hypothetical protein
VQIRFDAFATLAIEDQALAEAMALPVEALEAVAGGADAACVNVNCFGNTVCAPNAVCDDQPNMPCDGRGLRVPNPDDSNAVCFANVVC